MSRQFNVTAADNVFIGESKAIKVKCVDQAGAPLNLTGKTLSWTLRQGTGGAVLISKTSGAAQITLENGDGTNDVAVVALLPADTVDQGTGDVLIDPGRYAHALKSEGDEAVLSYGDFTLRLSAAR